jgi:hypothetical protein
LFQCQGIRGPFLRSLPEPLRCSGRGLECLRSARIYVALIGKLFL